MAASKRVSFLYAIGGPEETDAFKIGITDYPNRRLYSIQTGNHLELGFYWLIPIWSGRERDIEFFIHDLLSAHRLNGEWFSSNETTEKILYELNDCVTEGDLRNWIKKKQLDKKGAAEIESEGK